MKHLHLTLLCTLSLGSLTASVMPAEYHLERMTDKQKEFLTKNADEVIKRYPAGDIMHEMAKKLRDQNRIQRQAAAIAQAQADDELRAEIRRRIPYNAPQGDFDPHEFLRLARIFEIGAKVATVMAAAFALGAYAFA